MSPPGGDAWNDSIASPSGGDIYRRKEYAQLPAVSEFVKRQGDETLGSVGGRGFPSDLACE